MNRRLKIVISLVVFVLIIVLIVCANVFIQNKTISEVDITVNYGKGDTIVNASVIRNDIIQQYGDISKFKRKNIDANAIENFLNNMPYVEESQVYINLGGRIDIKIKQSEPIVRVYAKGGLQFYIDKRAEIIPLQEGAVADVIIASGNIYCKREDINNLILDSVNIYGQSKTRQLLYKLYNLSLKIKQDDLLSYQIDQIYVVKDDEFELYPKVGDYVIKIGDVEDMEEKLLKLKYLYKEGFTRSGWDNYSCVNLCFKNQAVCTKK